jgi:hypothetical protein
MLYPADDSTVCSLVEQAIVLEQNYKEMLLQGDELDLHIQIWRDALKTCKAESECMSHICDMRWILAD